jgi:repressor LexA
VRTDKEKTGSSRARIIQCQDHPVADTELTERTGTMMGYTKRQREMMEFIALFQRQNGVPPTLEEIGRNFTISRVTAFQHVNALCKRGALARRRKEARALEILDPYYKAVPLLGTISAGAPMEVAETPEPLDLREFFPTRGDYYVLKVQGDSMIEDHIENGDLVLVERRTDPNDGDTVVAILPASGPGAGTGVEETTLKRFYREGGGSVRLEPRNQRLKPLHVREVEIRGIVRGVLRKY